MAYPQECKDSILKKLLSPANKSVAEAAKEEGIPSGTIYNWRVKANQSGTLWQERKSKQITEQQKPSCTLL